MLRHITLAALLALGMTPAFATDTALVLGVDDYAALDDVRGGVSVERVAQALDDAGFSVHWRADFNGASGRNATNQFFADSMDADRLVVVLSGRFATDGTRSWLLNRGAEVTNLVSLGDNAISLETLLLILGQTPGQAVLVLAPDRDDDGTRYSPLLQAGIGNLDIPQGVTVVTGRGGDAGRLVRQVLSQPGVDVIEAVAEDPRLALQGYAPRSLVLTRNRDMRTGPQIGFGNSNAQRQAERDLWIATEDADTAEAYQRYLNTYPQGTYATEARRALQDLRNDPNRQARLREEALNLTRSQRRGIQADLNVLTYNTRGVDGIFGPGTRTAIRNWQQQNGFGQTGFITENQMVRLDAQALRRTNELEAEAERQRLAEESRDRAFWEETGSDGREAGLRAYLSRYPDGLSAARAAQQLREIEQRQRDQAQAAERRAWDRAREADTPAAYRRYLRAFPQGTFVNAAEARITSGEQVTQNRAARQAARAAEQALGLDPVLLRLIEARLDSLGLEPGPVDGRFDRDTRRALRNFQRDRGLDRTGFLDQATASRLLRARN